MELRSGRSHRFSSLLAGTTTNACAPWDTVISATDLFIAAPTKGALTAGWLLVIPKRVVRACVDLTTHERCELTTFVESLTNRMEGIFGPCTLFEHGASSVGSIVGCGVDQAHLHITSLPFDLAAAAQADRSVNATWRDTGSRELPFAHLKSGVEYLFVRKPGSNCILTTSFTPTSQYFRKIIAAQLGIYDQWDYRKHPFATNVAATLTRMNPM